MKFTIKNTKKYNITALVRKIGYKYIGKTQNNEFNIVRPFERGGYPRFHIYLTITPDELRFNLHLDQKKPVYENSTAHSGDYEGKVVEGEAEAVKNLLK